MKLFYHATPILALMSAFLHASVKAEDECPILSCCDDDCCEPGTVWQDPRCVLDSLSPGWVGHGSDYVDGCSDRSCCGPDCCEEMLGTVFDPTIGACVPSGGQCGEDPKPCRFIHELRVFLSPGNDLIGFLYKLFEVHSDECFADVESAAGVFEFESGLTGTIASVNDTDVMGLTPLPTLPSGVTIPGTGILDVGGPFGTITSINIDLALQLTCACKPGLLPRYTELSGLRVLYNPMYGWLGSAGAVVIPGGLGWQWEQSLSCDGTPGDWDDINNWSRTDPPPPPPPGAAGAAINFGDLVPLDLNDS